MSRIARQISDSGIYHVVFRGINKQDIFEEAADYKKMLEILKSIKEDIQFEIYVYCFMSNHVHLLLKENKQGEISSIMKRLLTTYAMWYNKKYYRTGALIAGRYKSQPVDVDDYFLCVVRYIHQNPVKAKMVESVDMYKWSSYGAYIDKNDCITSTDFVYSLLPKEQFEEFHRQEEREVFIVDDKIKLTDEAIRRAIITEYEVEPMEIGGLPKKNRNALLAALKEKYSIRQIERVCGISRGIISRM